SRRTTIDGERGLLGIAFSPDGDTLYASYTNRDGDSRLDAYRMDGGRAAPGSRRELLAVAQPFSNHNGGNVVTGPDGMLYLGLGDGGGSGDPDGNAQDLGTLLGSLLRIDPGGGGDGRPYGIPDGNPFVDREGARPEIYAYGLRNPWRFSFDRDTGDLWIGDVGQGELEEIDHSPEGQAAGVNYGWDRFEGTRPYEGGPRGALAFPVFEYSHDEGCSVTGGYVYRGRALPALRGAYVFSDFCAGGLRALRPRDGQAARAVDLPGKVSSVVSFGEDAAGELYVLSLDGPVYRLAASPDG
ncbi:MAG: PQQ-dependent sugar dehydrogenase, partial [Euzebyales bacterium]|nr:PQQ-dependent sugar dehydrogenase [Euzebyales bacterium]